MSKKKRSKRTIIHVHRPSKQFPLRYATVSLGGYDGPRLTVYDKKLLVASEGHVEGTFVQTMVHIPWGVLARALRLARNGWTLRSGGTP